jgi:hypothetical protein
MAVDFVVDLDERERAALSPPNLTLPPTSLDVWGDYLRDWQKQRDGEWLVEPSSHDAGIVGGVETGTVSRLWIVSPSTSYRLIRYSVVVGF